jgi:hypothetical protein
MSDKKEQEGSERYEKILAQSTNTMKLFDKIERAQRGRRLKAWLRWWWNKLTFQGYKNEREVRRQEEQQFRREIERKARQIESGKK